MNKKYGAIFRIEERRSEEEDRERERERQGGEAVKAIRVAAYNKTRVKRFWDSL